jgi:tetratricopeptide (TPR) repeat protein
MKRFTTREVAKIVGLPEGRVRACVRAGLVTPARGARRHLAFAFQDLLLLRTTKGLLAARIPVRRLRRLLASLRRQLPAGQELSSVTIYADGRRVVAWDGTARWQPDSGQFLFTFDAREVARTVELPARRPAPAAEPRPAPLTAPQWFALASELEGTAREEARRAYQQALALDPGLADAHVNLGRLCHEAGERAQAEAHYRAAVAQAPTDPTPHFNLGVLLEDLGRPEDAIRAYRQALALNGAFADAHYNLGLLYDAHGRRPEAIRHLRAARTLYRPPRAPR